MTTTRPPVNLAPDDLALPLSIPGRHGVRLEEFQMLNWGTFDGTVQRLTLDGANGLLTGQVGAGKSTIVDGLTTLFAPSSKVVFNRAAGAERTERTLATYVLGHYRNIFDESTGSSRPESLRNAKNVYSVLLARFTGLPGGVTVSAGVIYYFEASGALHRLYFTAPVALDIAGHLVGHGDTRAVRNALRAAGADTFDENFKHYQRSLCRYLGVGPGALDLLVQTVSMKSVGNLTAFVRQHMLDPVDAASKIVDILEHWADLTRAYELVLTARAQLDRLEPVAEFAAAYDRAEARIAASREAGASVPALVERRRVDLLSAAIADLENQLPELEARVTTLKAQHEQQGTTVTQLAVAVQQSGGAELLSAQHQLQLAENALAAARKAFAELAALAAAAGVTAPEGSGDWSRFTAAVTTARSEQDAETKTLKSAEYQALRAHQDARDELGRMHAELDEASRRDSNVPIEHARLRGRIATELGLDLTDLPYAAELITVSAEASQWEAAAERLVRPLALSLLVAEIHYPRVAAWVDAQHLGQRLVYYRVPDSTSASATPRPGTMAADLEVRPGTPFTAWLRAEVNRRFDHACVDSAADLARHTRAVTRAGQIKDNARHEKDDRRHVADRRFYVLGWDTAARRAALAEALPQQQTLVNELGRTADRTTANRARQTQRGYALDQIASRFPDPTTVDVAAAHDAVSEARGLHETLANSPELAELIDRKEAAERRASQLLDALGEAQGEVGDARAQLSRYQKRHSEAATRLASIPEPPLSAEADEALTEALDAAGYEPASVDVCDAWGRSVSEELANRQTSATNTLARNGQRLVGAMKDFANIWPQVVADLGTEPEAREDYLALRERLRADDLPSYEADFREQLQTNAIHELVAFSHFLESESRKISGRIDTINSALVDIDYRPGTYIRLENEPTTDVEIREFRGQLREITANTLLGDDETYAEERFLRVKELLDRFTGRDGNVSADQAWKKRVTDVRNWHSFAASERTRDEDVAVEHYTDSGGKSGGQKEKLAYTILAASLSYQYGLAGGALDTFRFVMIDEAFGRGSDESTRFALELFDRLQLQLLVVTPLQKIGTIAPFVEAVGYVRIEDPRSRLITMPIGDYEAWRAKHREERRAGRITSLPTRPGGADDADGLDESDGADDANHGRDMPEASTGSGW